MQRPDRDDYAACACRQMEAEGVEGFCSGCEEYDAARYAWRERGQEDGCEAADGLADLLKDEDIRRG